MPRQVTIYNRDTGEPATMDAVDARRALKAHPKEWSSQSPVAVEAEGEAEGEAKKPAAKKTEPAKKDAETSG